MSVRVRLTLSYAGFLVVAGALLLAVVWVFLLRYVPDPATREFAPGGSGMFPTRSELERAFVPRAATALAVLLALGLGGGWMLAGRMLAPLERIARATRVAGAGTLTHRIELPGRNDEFRLLADSFDAMLARLESHVDEQQRFAANASHELRTPLATMRAQLEVARADPDRDTDALLERLTATNEHAIELTEALLVLARADRGAFVAEPVDLSLVVEEVIETLLPAAEARGIEIEHEDEGVTGTSGSHALIHQLVTNVVHNAVVHNLATGGAIRIVTRAARGVVVLAVENTGPVVDPDVVATLTEPFRRGAGRVRGHASGVGLGLAIVSSVVTAHGGELTLAARSGGGLHVVVQLPT